MNKLRFDLKKIKKTSSRGNKTIIKSYIYIYMSNIDLGFVRFQNKTEF